VIFEPNAAPGFTNRVLADMATRIGTGYSSVAERWGRKAVFTGCPVRKEFFSLPPRTSAVPYSLLITGGSQGARAVNRAVLASLEHLAQHARNLSIVHQTGERDYEVVRTGYAERGVQAEVAPFFSNMPERFAKADLIVCRSGANAVAEVAAAGRAAIFIPFGAATDSHQLRNAQEMVAAGAARLIPEPELNGARLAREILLLTSDPKRLTDLSTRAKAMGRPAAARDLADLIEEVALA
jgi:UDP-N-acetylglucosamine--N-acetylmuramyl-(pentapeptide) pyrophosphoryl-undecaprenol N-acetylglucosamine transferase